MTPSALCSAGLALVLLAAFLLCGRRLLRPGQALPHVQTEYAVSLRSAMVYVAMGVAPLAFPCLAEETGRTKSWSECPQSPYRLIPTNLMRMYHWLPFWYAFLVSTHSGALLAGVWEAVNGTVIGLLAASFMNYLVPGGAGGPWLGVDFVRRGWLPGGYSQTAVICYAMLVTYVLFLSKRTTGTKQYALGTFSSLLVPFMNPETRTGFRAVLWDWDFEWNWNGQAMCGVWLIALAVISSGLSLGLVPCSRRSVQQHSSLAVAAEALADLALDTEGCLEWLLADLQQETWKFHVESSYFYIRQLGSRRTKVEQLLSEVPWTLCCDCSQKREQLEELWNLAELLRHLRQVLRVELEHVRSLGDPGARELGPQLQEFLVACGDGLSALARSCKKPGGLSSQTSQAVKQAALRADSVLVKALLQLDVDDQGRPPSAQMAFVDRLRSWPTLLAQAAEASAAGGVAEAAASTSSWSERHWFALRNTTSWTLALLWSVFKRGYHGSCVVGVSFIFSATSGSSFDTNINRMIGVGMGLGVGNVPAILILSSSAEGEAYLLYFVVLFITWTLAMYGYLATGSKYKLACLLWAGNSGVQMLSHIPHFDKPAPGLFMDVLDNFLGCIVVFVVDIMFAYFQGSGTSQQVKAAVLNCIHSLVAVVEELKAGKLTEIHLRHLQEHIKAARFWDSEIQKEGLIWTTLWEAPYKADSVSALLDHLDEVYVAVYALRASARRCCSESVATAVVRDILDDGIRERCKLFEHATRLILSGSDAESMRDLHELLEAKEEVILEKTPSRARLRRNRSVELCSRLRGTSEANSPDSPPLSLSGEAKEVPEVAALEAVKLSSVALQIAVQRIGGILAAGSALASQDWRKTRPSRSSPLGSPTLRYCCSPAAADSCSLPEELADQSAAGEASELLRRRLPAMPTLE